MLFLDKKNPEKLIFILDSPENSAFDLDMILAASTLYENIHVFITPDYDQHNPLKKQFSALPEFGIPEILIINNNTEIINTLKNIKTNLANLDYDKLVNTIIDPSQYIHSWSFTHVTDA